MLNSRRVHLADKSCVQAQKTLLLPITIANRTRKHRVYVAPNLWRPCIIGNDFIQQYKLQIGGGRQQVYFKRLVAKKPNALNTKPIQANEEEYTLLASECIKVPLFIFPISKYDPIKSLLAQMTNHRRMK